MYTTTANYTNFIADGNLFGSYSGSTNLTFTSGIDIAIDEAMILATPNGNWQGYHQSGGVFSSDQPSFAGETKYDTGVTGLGYTAIQLCSDLEPTFGGNTGIYQRIYGLEIGKTYVIKADILSPTVIDVTSEIEIGDKTSGEFTTFNTSSSNLLSGTQLYTSSFTATDDTADIYIDLYGEVSSCFHIKRVKVNELFSEADLTFSDFEDGSVALDLYDDNIPLTLSVASFTDATSNLQSYSKDFNLPSTKRNDRVFSHIYDLNTSIKNNPNAFNPYIKTVATLKEDGIEIFSGELSLNTISKNSEGIQYDVNLQSRISGLADALEGKKLVDINFNELNHDFTKSNIINSWTTGVTLTSLLTIYSDAYKGSLTSTDVVKYPFVNWTGNILDSAQNGGLLLSRLEDAFRPFINIKYILDRIFKASGFTYESEFMDTDTFTKLYMDFNHGGENGASPSATADGGTNRFKVKYNGGGRWLTPDYTRFVFDNNNITGVYLNPIVGQAYWDTSDNSFKPLVDGTSLHLYGAIPCYNTTNSDKNVSWRTIHEKNDGSKEVIHTAGAEISGSPLTDPSESYTPNLDVTLALGDSIYFEGRTSTGDPNKVRQQDISNSDHFFDTYMYFEDISAETTSMSAILNEARGDIGQWDFLKSLINMFNLIVSPDPDRSNHLIIEPYESIFGVEAYASATKKDWSDKVDADGFTIKIMDLDKSVDFTCIKDKNDFPAQIYSESVPTSDGDNYNYGDLSYKASEFTNLSGVSSVENKVFSSTIVKPLNSYVPLSNFITPAIYKGEGDDVFKVYKNKPRILYDNGVKFTSSTYSAPAQNGDSALVDQSDYLLFTPFSEFSLSSGAPSTAKDINWRECFSIITNESVNGLFNEYWSGYYDELYHTDTRIFSVECLLNNNDISNFLFTDIIVIENSEFRVNNINYSSEGLSRIELIKLP